jgi:hypothetical protein
MPDADGVIHPFQQRRQLEEELDALAAIAVQAALQEAVRRLAERYPPDLLLAAILRRLGTPNSQLRGGLGLLCTLLPAAETANALRGVVGNRARPPQERTTAALILQRFLDQPAPPALLADLAGAEEAPYQSLLEAVDEGKHNRHVLLEYVTQMQEHPVDVAFMVLRLIDRLPPADGSELLRLIAHDARPQVAHAAIDRLAAAAATPGGEACLRSLHTLTLALPPAGAALAARSLRKLQFSGKRYTPPAAAGWQALLGPSDPSGYASAWFVRYPLMGEGGAGEGGAAGSPDAADDGVWLGFVLSLRDGILQFSGSAGMQRDYLPPLATPGELVTVRTSSGQTAVLLAIPFELGRWLLQQALAAHWRQASGPAANAPAGSGAAPPAAQPTLPGEYALYNDLLWQFAAPDPAQLPADLAAWVARTAAGDSAAPSQGVTPPVTPPVTAQQAAAAAAVLVQDAAMEGWLRWAFATWQNVKYRSQQTPEVPPATLVSLLLRELGRLPDHRLLLGAMAAGLRLQTLWYAAAGDPANAERAALLARVTANWPVIENPLIAGLLERGLNKPG